MFDMTREKKHCQPYVRSRCGGILRRLYARNDTDGQNSWTRTTYLLCTKCKKIVTLK